MSTIKSSSEHLTLNADGTGKEIKLQNNGTTNVTLDSSGNMGVGTSSPDNKLTIADSATIAVGKQWGLDFQDTVKGEPQAYIYAEGRYSANYNTDLVFGTIGTSGDATERMRILSSGGITFNGDTSSSNALDDYEEGTWTPSYWSGTGEGAFSSMTGVTSSNCYYTKIGNMCTVWGSIKAVNPTGNVAIGDRFGFQSLPFSSAGTHLVNAGTAHLYQSLGGDVNAWSPIFLDTANNGIQFEFIAVNGAPNPLMDTQFIATYMTN